MDLILRPFAWLLLMLYNMVNNYGIALILFAVLVKLILFPFSLKGKKGMIKMNMLSTETQRLQKMYAKNPARYNEEVQKLYEREKVNPMSGCLWTFLPLFILIPLYSVIRQPMKYMMNMAENQITAVANALNWGQHSMDMGWVKDVTDAASNAYTSGAYNELYLTSMITESNLASAQAAAGEGASLFAMNFDFLGIDLSQVPNWQFWSNGMDWSTIGLFLLVVVSALSGILSSRITMKTNTMNNQEQNDQVARTNRTMMWTMPLMSIWIGFMMPGLLNVYWIANNLLAMVQELIAGKILKKDYEEAARLREETAAQAKEEEKKRKRELAEKRAREAEEAKKNKKLAAELKAAEDKKDSANIDVSRVGIRSYARGRSYDPGRFGGVTAYRDPNEIARERAEQQRKAAEAAAEEKKNKKSSKKNKD